MVTMRQRKAIEFCEGYGYPSFFQFCRDNGFPNPYDYEYNAVSAYLSAYLNQSKIQYCQENYCPAFNPMIETQDRYISTHYNRACAISEARKIYKWASLGYSVKEPNWETLTIERAKKFTGAYRIRAEQMYSEVMSSAPDPWYD